MPTIPITIPGAFNLRSNSSTKIQTPPNRLKLSPFKLQAGLALLRLQPEQQPISRGRSQEMAPGMSLYPTSNTWPATTGDVPFKTPFDLSSPQERSKSTPVALTNGFNPDSLRDSCLLFRQLTKIWFHSNLEISSAPIQSFNRTQQLIDFFWFFYLFFT